MLRFDTQYGYYYIYQFDHDAGRMWVCEVRLIAAHHSNRYNQLYRIQPKNYAHSQQPLLLTRKLHYKVWDEIIYPFLNFNGATDEVWEWISYFITPFTEHYPCRD